MECQLCGENAPEALACGHALCRTCLEHLVRPECPFCRRTVDVPDSVHARHLAEKYAAENRDAFMAMYLSLFPHTPLETLYSAMEKVPDPWVLLGVRPDDIQRYVETK